MEITSRDLQKEIGRYIDAALSGESVVVARRGRPVVVLVPIEQHNQQHKWAFAEQRWRNILNRMAAKWPVQKTDYELVTDLLQRWEIEQDAGNSKSDLLFAVLFLLAVVAKAVGVTASVDAVKQGGNELKNLWKGEVQP